MRNIACIYRYLKGEQFEVAFYLNYIRMYKPRKRSPRGPYMCYVYPVGTCSPCFSARPEGNTSFKPFCVLRGSFPISVAKPTVLAAACFLWAKGYDPESRARGYGKAVVRPLPAGAQSWCFISVTVGSSSIAVTAAALLVGEKSRGCNPRCFKDPIQHLPSCNYPHVCALCRKYWFVENVKHMRPHWKTQKYPL